MNCRDFIDLIIDFCDGSLPQEVKQEFELHAATCHTCDTYLVSYQCTIQLGKAACEGEKCTDLNMPESLVQKIIKARESGSQQA